MIHYDDGESRREEDPRLIQSVGLAMLKLVAFYAAGAIVFVSVMSLAGAQFF